METIDQKIVRMRKAFYKANKRTPKELHLGKGRLIELISELEDLQGREEAEIIENTMVYGMKIVLHPTDTMLGMK